MRMVGRGQTMRRAAAGLRAQRGVLLYGPPGIGKSTLADALAGGARDGGVRVLRASPAEVEAELPYLVLIDLFADLLATSCGRGLPGHLRDALDVALLRTGGAETRPDELAVRIAVLELLRRLAADGPALIVLDDAQWADQASADVIAFAVRRLGDLPVAFLITERVTDGEPTTRRLCPDAATALPVPPLARTDIADLLTGTGTRATRRIWEASGGNPMYALELARALGPTAPADHEPLPVPDRLRALLAKRVTGLDDATRTALLYAALVARPNLALLIRAGVLPPDGLRAAERAQVVTTNDAGDVRFPHPLLRELVAADAGNAARRETHAALAALVDEPVERARHRALGNPAADEDTAALAETAAADAAKRGAPGTALSLARLAAQRTPPQSSGVLAARHLTAAGYAHDAGHVDEARDLATAALTGEPGTRVRARLRLIDLAGADLTGVAEHLEAARADATGDTHLEARVDLYAATLAYFERRHADAVELADRAVGLARLAGDRELIVEALVTRAHLGNTESDGIYEQAYLLAGDMPLSTPVADARQMWAMTALFRGDLGTAVDEITRLESDVRSRGLVADLMSVLISTTSVNVRAGHGEAALRAGRECERLFLDAAPSPGPGLVSAANAEWCAGTPRTAVERAARAIAGCEEHGDIEWLEVALVLHGQALLLSGDPAAAVLSFQRAIDLEKASGLRDPAIIPWHADHVEALVAVGDLGRAEARLDDLDRRVTEFGRDVIRLPAARARALLTAARGDHTRALDALRTAVDTLTGYPIEVARAELTFGRLARRARRRALARQAFTAAAETFAAIGAEAHLTVARDELDRLDHPGGDRLSEADRRLVEMVRSGATNREVGAALFLSVKAVEARLSRLYRRFGVRNRAELLGRLEP